MNFWSHPKSLFFLILSSLLLLSSGVTQPQDIEKEVFTLFAHIEGSEEQVVEKATQELIKIGSPAIPYIKKRLEQTGLPRYLYILKQISSQQKDSTPLWNKNDYFEKRYKEVAQLLREGYPEKATELAKAILVLEPNTPFKKQLEELVRESNSQYFSQAILKARVSTPKQLYNFAEEIPLTFALINQTSSGMVVDTQEKKIVLRIATNDFDLASHKTVDVRTKIIKLPSKIEIPPGKQWSAKFSLENPNAKVIIFRQIICTARIPLVKVTKGDEKPVHPHIVFPPSEIYVLPKSYHPVVLQSSKNFTIALRLSKPIAMFYTSFFIPERQQQETIGFIIENLEKMNKETLAVSFGILRRLTQKNYLSIFRWKNWWLAQRTPK